MKTQLSIIIPTKNEEAYLPRLLTSIKSQILQPAEIIIADNASTDKTREIAKKFNCKVVSGGDHPGIGRNKGAAVAKYPLLLFLDADVLLPNNDFLEKTTQEFYQRGLGIACCLAAVDSSNLIDLLGTAINNGYYLLTETTIKNGVGFCTFVLKEVHEKIGGYDEKVAIAEDQDYVRRASKLVKYRFLRSEKVIFSLRRYAVEGKVRLFFKYLYIYFHTTFRGKILKEKIPYRFDHRYNKD